MIPIELHFHELGSGEPIVFLHGLGSRKEAWEPQHALAHSYRLILPDLRGHGQSPVGDKPLTIRQFAADVLELLDHLQIDTFHLCGLSLGGLVAQHIATTSRRLRSLILANTTSFIPLIPGDFYANWRVYLFTLLEQEHFVSRMAKMCLYHSDDVHLLEQAKKAFFCREDSYIPTTKQAVGVSYREKLKQIHVPTLLIASQYDLVTPMYAMIDMKQLIPRSRLVILQNAGHLSNIEKAEEFNRLILSFLQEQRENPFLPGRQTAD